MGNFGDLTSLLRFVLPGLVVAWVFYGLTSYQKPGEFERMAQALVFTALLDVLARGTAAIGVLIGRLWHPVLPAADLSVLATAEAVPLGLLVAFLANNDIVHAILRRRGVAVTSGHPDQWDSAFRRFRGYVTLDLFDGRQVAGWPLEWPDRPSDGFFVLLEPRWTAGGTSSVSGGAILIPAREVQYVQWLEREA